MRGSTSNGWSDEHLDDESDMEEDQAWSGGAHRPGEKYTTEEEFEDEWGNDDDDDHGGQMMPIPDV